MGLTLEDFVNDDGVCHEHISVTFYSGQSIVFVETSNASPLWQSLTVNKY